MKMCTEAKVFVSCFVFFRPFCFCEFYRTLHPNVLTRSPKLCNQGRSWTRTILGFREISVYESKVFNNIKKNLPLDTVGGAAKYMLAWGTSILERE